MTIPLQTLRTVRGVCPHDCPDTCGFLVHVDDATGRAVRLQGDPDHPFTDGFLCTKVAHYVERTYHDSRVLYPKRRVGPKGAGQFERISWDEALATIAANFQGVIDSPDGAQAILPYSYAGTMGKLHYASLDRRFFHAIGASLLDRTICSTAGEVGCDITLGTRAALDPEAVVHAKYIINWGSNTSVTNSHLWALMHRARKSGAKIVTIDPHKSRTARQSDWWVPVRPGTDAALALGLMHVLFRDGLTDGDYLERYCVGTAELKARVEAEFPPAAVARITGLPAETIEALAREYGTSLKTRGGPGFIRLNYGLQRHGGGAAAVRAVACLPAITGDWRHAGGGALLSTSKMFAFNGAYLERPDLIRPGTRTVNMIKLAEALAGELPGPPVKALYVYNSNPAAVAPDQSRVLAGLKREDLFTVVHEQFHTDTADYADILLPATTQLEHFDIHAAYGHFYAQVNHAAIAPLGESLPNTEVFRRLGRGMNLDPALFAETDEELARGAMQGTRKYFPPGDPFEGITFDRLMEGGPVRLSLPPDYAPFAEGGFPTPSGKCEFYSAREAAAGRDPLPGYVPPHEDPQTRPDLAAKYPLQLITPPTPAFLNSSFANVESSRKQAGDPVVEMHPVDAAARGITAGETVRVVNGRGMLMARAVVGETVPPGTVVSFGIWWNKHTAQGVNVNTLTSTATTDQGGAATFFDNLVEVERLAAGPTSFPVPSPLVGEG